MSKVKVGVAGYGVIGQRLADGATLQDDMELVGIVDIAQTLSIRALFDSANSYNMYVFEDSQKKAFEDLIYKAPLEETLL